MEGAKQSDSLISHRSAPANFAFIHRRGIDELGRQEMANMELLSYLLEHYDDGRSKSFYCTACQLTPLDSLRAALAQAEAEISERAGAKEKARLPRAAISHLAGTLDVDLQLRK